MYYVTHISQRGTPDDPSSGDGYMLDLERREFIREAAVRLLVSWRERNCQTQVAHAQAARCWQDAEALWAERPWED